MTFNIREIIKKGEYKNHGKMEFPILPAIFSQVEKREVKKEKKKENIVKVKEYCEKEGISIDDYRKIEKVEKDKEVLINQLSNGIIVIKNKKYKVMNYEFINYDAKKQKFRNNVIRTINIARLGGK